MAARPTTRSAAAWCSSRTSKACSTKGGTFPVEKYGARTGLTEGEIDGEPWLVRICTVPPREVEPKLGTDGVRFWSKADNGADK